MPGASLLALIWGWYIEAVVHVTSVSLSRIAFWTLRLIRSLGHRPTDRRHLRARVTLGARTCASPTGVEPRGWLCYRLRRGCSPRIRSRLSTLSDRRLGSGVVVVRSHRVYQLVRGSDDCALYV